MSRFYWTLFVLVILLSPLFLAREASAIRRYAWNGTNGTTTWDWDANDGTNCYWVYGTVNNSFGPRTQPVGPAADNLTDYIYIANGGSVVKNSSLQAGQLYVGYNGDTATNTDILDTVTGNDYRGVGALTVNGDVEVNGLRVGLSLHKAVGSTITVQDGAGSLRVVGDLTVHSDIRLGRDNYGELIVERALTPGATSTVTIGSASSLASIQFSGTEGTAGSTDYAGDRSSLVDFSKADTVTIYAQDFGVASDFPNVSESSATYPFPDTTNRITYPLGGRYKKSVDLKFGVDNTVTAKRFFAAGSILTNLIGAPTTIEFGEGTNQLNIDHMVLGYWKSEVGDGQIFNGASIREGGTFTLNGSGGVGTKANLYVSYSDCDTANTSMFQLDLRAASAVNMTLDQFVIGQKMESTYGQNRDGGSEGRIFLGNNAMVTADKLTMAYKGVEHVGTPQTLGLLEFGGASTLDIGTLQLANTTSRLVSTSTINMAGGYMNVANGAMFSDDVFLNISSTGATNAMGQTNGRMYITGDLDTATAAKDAFQMKANLVMRVEDGGSFVVDGDAVVRGYSEIHVDNKSEFRVTGNLTERRHFQTSVTDGSRVVVTGDARHMSSEAITDPIALSEHFPAAGSTNLEIGGTAADGTRSTTEYFGDIDLHGATTVRVHEGGDLIVHGAISSDSRYLRGLYFETTDPAAGRYQVRGIGAVRTDEGSPVFSWVGMEALGGTIHVLNEDLHTSGNTDIIDGTVFLTATGTAANHGLFDIGNPGDAETLLMNARNVISATADNTEYRLVSMDSVNSLEAGQYGEIEVHANISSTGSFELNARGGEIILNGDLSANSVQDIYNYKVARTQTTSDVNNDYFVVDAEGDFTTTEEATMAAYTTSYTETRMSEVRVSPDWHYGDSTAIRVQVTNNGSLTVTGNTSASGYMIMDVQSGTMTLGDLALAGKVTSTISGGEFHAGNITLTKYYTGVIVDETLEAKYRHSTVLGQKEATGSSLLQTGGKAVIQSITSPDVGELLAYTLTGGTLVMGNLGDATTPIHLLQSGTTSLLSPGDTRTAGTTTINGNYYLNGGGIWLDLGSGNRDSLTVAGTLAFTEDSELALYAMGGDVGGVQFFDELEGAWYETVDLVAASNYNNIALPTYRWLNTDKTSWSYRIVPDENSFYTLQAYRKMTPTELPEPTTLIILSISTVQILYAAYRRRGRRIRETYHKPPCKNYVS